MRAIRATQAKRKLALETVALLAVIALASMLARPAHGQAPNDPPPGSAPCLPHQPPGSPGTPPVGTTGEAESGVAPPDNLSDRLARADGVICPPPGVDPEIRLPTPDTGRTPVIPPPGSPGGDPSIRPK